MRGWPRQWHCPWHCWYLKCLWRRHDLFDSFWISAVIWCQQHLTPHCICREVWWFAELCFGVVGVAVSSCILGYKESSRRVSDDMGRPLHFRSQSPYLVVSTTCCSLPLMMRMVMMHSLNVFFLMGETCKLKECVGQMLAWNDLTPLLRRTVSGLLFGPPRKVLWRRGAPLTGWWRHSLEWWFFFSLNPLQMADFFRFLGKRCSLSESDHPQSRGPKNSTFWASIAVGVNSMNELADAGSILQQPTPTVALVAGHQAVLPAKAPSIKIHGKSVLECSNVSVIFSVRTWQYGAALFELSFTV